MATAEARFWAKVTPRTADECWPWEASTFKRTGYGVSHPNREVTTTAHRFCYELHHGPVPAGLNVDHRCHNEQECPPATCTHRVCVNPAHLEAVTPKENNNRSPNANIRKTHCPRGHEYTPENTRHQVKPNGVLSRKCRACGRLKPWNRRK